MDKARSWIALCAVAVACSAPRPAPSGRAPAVASASAPASTSTPASASASSASAPVHGLRLVYGVTPSDDASMTQAIEGARRRVAGMKLETPFSLARDGRTIVATIGATDETTMEAVRALIPGTRLSVAPLADDDASLGSTIRPPAGIALGRERAPFGDRGSIELIFAWSEAQPSKVAARDRLAAWLSEVTGGRRSFAFGPYQPDDAIARKAVRAYALDGAALALTVDDAQVLDGDLPALGVTLAPSSARAFEALTEQRVNRRIALLTDVWVITTPLVRSKITGGHLMISPDTRWGPEGALREARDLEIALRLSHGGPKLELERVEKAP